MRHALYSAGTTKGNITKQKDLTTEERKSVICVSDAELATIPNMERLICAIFNCILI